RAPSLLDPPHPPDLAAVLPGGPDRVLPAARPRGTTRDDRLPGNPANPLAAVPGIPGQLVDGADPPGRRLAQRALERLRRGAVLPDRAAVHRPDRPAAPTPDRRRADRCVDRRARLVCPSLRVAAHDRV